MIAASSITPMIEYFYPDKVQADVNEPIDFQFSANDVWRADISVFYIEFHDGSLPIELTPEKINITHTFQNEGKYLITLTAVAISGLTDVKTCEIEIINEPPIFDIDLPNTAFEDEKISASVINLIDSAQDCENAKYHWNFGDGTFLTTKNINKTWSNEGIYPVTVTVFDDQGALDTKTEFIEIINVAPVADFVIESLKSDCPYIININENEVVVYEACPLYFNASFSYDTLSDLNGILYYWDFDDGQIGTGIGVVHQFMQSGNYTVTLRVKDDNGDIGITQKIIQVVNEAPWIELLTKNIILKEGETFTFETDSSDSLPDYPFLKYSWDFGDYGWRASNLWLDDFTGDISVNVTDLEGLSDTDSTNIVVENVPPNINLNWAYVAMNITISIKAPTPKPCNFSIEFLENDETIGVYIVKKSSGDNRVETPPLPFFMDLSRNYTIKVNRTHVLEPGTYFVYLEFSFLDGKSFTISSSFNEHWPGWKVSPNEWILNPENYIFDMPITLGGSIFDPSIDDIHLDIDFKTHLLLEIDFPGSAEFVYPYRTTITLQHDPNHIIYDAYVYNESGKIYSDLTFSQNLASIDYIDNEFPTTIPIDATAYPIDLSFLDMHKKINIDGAFVIDVIEAVNTFDVYVSDDDGGEDSKTVKIDTTKGTAKVINLAPDIYIYTLHNSTEDSVVPMRVDVFDFENDTVSVQWNFGDGSPLEIDPLDGSDIHHVYENEGTYLITVTATDGKMITKMGRVIQIFNKPPELKIELNPNIIESQLVILNNTYVYDDSASDKETLRFYWDFGDGSNYYQLEFDPFWCSQCGNQQVELAHSWAEQGFYNLTLYVIDDNGDIGSVTIVMNVTNVAPFIEGPYGFENIEGHVINLDVAVFDSFKDELNLSYTWEIDGQTLYGKKPSIYLDDGNYTANLIVTDNDGETSNAEIDLIIEDIRPEVSIRSKSIYGAPGEIKLTAYSLDTFLDVDTLYYNWSFNSITLFERLGDISSSVFYEYTNSSTVTGLVEVFDDTGKRGMATFQLFIIMDSDGDGLTDEYEVQIGSSPDDSDSDSDFITDWYEENIYGTDPLNADTDNDGLPDGYGMVTPNIFGGELWLGTNPLLNDTDGDKLTDGFEFIGWSLTTEYYPEGPDEDPESITYWVTSNPLLLDTDGDKVSDWEEYTHGTDPMNKDTDNDGIDDLEDLFPWKVDGDDDGLSDSKENEIGTDPNKADTDDDGLSDGEEYYPGQDGYITDPLNNDTDSDFLLDGQELYSTSKKIDKRIKINVGLNTFILYSERSERIASASLTLSISVGEGAQTTDLTIKLVMQGFTLFEKYAGNQRYFANITDIKELIEKSGRTFGGQWILEVHSTIECLLEEYEIDFTKYLNPNDDDTDNDGIKDGVEINPELNNGWITNPAKKDTDGDTINDGFEISMGWNPLSKDTDGDGVEDWKDVDPLHNLIVMVKVNQGHYDSWEQILTPLLQVTLEVEADPEHKWEVATPSSWASTGSKDINAWIPWLCEHCYDISWTLYWLECWWKKVCTNTWLGKICWYELRCAWRSKTFYSTICVWLPCLKEITLYTIQTTANFGQEYYFDVDDGDKDMTLKAELWKNYIVGWLPHVEGKITHNLMKSGYQMNVQKNKKIYSGSNWVSLDIETKGIPRVNTIAVYENGTFYKGHYSEIDRMNVVILNVISGTNQYFDSGINVILIPTPVFTNTKLHAIIETSVNENGQVSDSSWADVPACIKGAKIAGINRNDYKDTISPNVECVITKNVSANDAYDILLLAVTSANESEGIIFLFTSDYIAEELGIAADVLELIPLDISGFINSEVGEWPRTPWENFVQLIKDIIQFVIDVLVAIGQFFVALFEWIADVGMNLIEAVTQAVLAVVEAILKAIVLVFIWLMFAFTLIGFIAAYLAVIPLLFLIIPIINAELTIEINRITLTKGTKTLIFGYEIELIPISFLDLTIPSLAVLITSNDLDYKIDLNLFSNFDMELPLDLIPNSEQNHSGESTTPNTSQNQIIPQTSSESNGDLFITGFLAALSIMGVVMCFYGAIAVGLSSDKPKEIIFFILVIVAFLTSMMVLIKIVDETNDNISDFFAGLGWGCMFAFAELLFIFSFGETWKIPMIISSFAALVSVINIIANIGLIFNVDIMEIPATLIDLSAIAIGALAILNIPDKETKSRAMTTFLLLTFVSALVFLITWAFTQGVS